MKQKVNLTKLSVVETDRWAVFWFDPGGAWIDVETIAVTRSAAIRKFNKIYHPEKQSSGNYNYASERKKRACKALKICGKL